MGVLVSCRGLSHAFGARPLFRGVSFTLSEGDRVGLIGPNGAGKSTLLAILAGAITPDVGDVERRSELRVALVEQVPTLSGTTVRDAVAPSSSGSKPTWDSEAKVDEWLSKLDLAPDALVAELSGGWKKRVALARALVSEPELLLLDEPTNHLDVESIMWLERLLAQRPFATLTITHDRAFLQKVSNRILELDRRNPDGLLDVKGDYLSYVTRKAEAMTAQEQRQERLENTLRRETEWLKRGAKARSTKQRARLQRAQELAGEVSELSERNQKGMVSIDFQKQKKRPKRLIEARSVEKRFGDHCVIKDVDLFIGPKTRLGLLGPNGCGKSTLLGVLTGALSPSSGEVLRAEELSIAYFEQNRESLDPSLSVADTICPRGDYVDFRGSRLHRHGYLERFLFQPQQMRQPVSSLSGGEQSRLLVARLMLAPADVLVLDEPTNDLDLMTLTVLEEALSSFAGAVILVTHDRYFLDQVATEILAFHTKPEERGQVTSLVGLSQWETFIATQKPEKKRSVERADTTAAGGKKRKLSFNEQREWDGLEARILTAEESLAALEAECERPEVAVDPERLGQLAERMTKLRSDVDALYARWAELEALVDDPTRLH